MFVVTELEKLVGELSIGVLKTKRKQEQYEVRMDSHHISKYTVQLVAIDFLGGKRNLKMNFKKIISSSWGKHKGNQYHDGDFIPDKTYWRPKDFI